MKGKKLSYYATVFTVAMVLASMSANAQVTIGSNNPPTPKTLLDLDATGLKGGLRLPLLTETERNELVYDDSISTLRASLIGLMIFNTTAAAVEFWDGERWKKVFGDKEPPPGEAMLRCRETKLDPQIVVKGGQEIPPGTFLKIPYSASNSGFYNGATLYSVGNPDVMAVIDYGTLSPGSGILNFAITGTPTQAQEAPNGIVFDLQPFLDANTGNDFFADVLCSNIVVGNLAYAEIKSAAVMGYLKQARPEDNGGCTPWVLECTSPDGMFSVRVVSHQYYDGSVPARNVGHGNQGLNIQIKNNASDEVAVIWNYSTTWAASGTAPYNHMGILRIPPGVWGGSMETVGGANGTGWTNQSCTTHTTGYWGNVGIYDASHSGPEYRRYTWIPINVGTDNKKSYEITVMAAIDKLPLSAVHPTLVKAYIKLDEVTALGE